jgi:DNA-binding response OmpR family regulator
LNPATRLLLIEDDPQLGRALLKSLNDSVYATSWARSVEDGDLYLQTQRFDAILLDLGLPDGSGLDVLKHMRRRNDLTPVLILTARDAVEDRVRGLDGGADDYLVKPFAIPELLSRVRALVRRSSGFASSLWRLGELTLDVDARVLKVADAAVDLSPREFQLLYLLARNVGRVVSRASLEEGVFDLGEEPESNAIEVHIHHLRRKLGGQRIRTVRGLGYLLEAE